MLPCRQALLPRRNRGSFINSASSTYEQGYSQCASELRILVTVRAAALITQLSPGSRGHNNNNNNSVGMSPCFFLTLLCDVRNKKSCLLLFTSKSAKKKKKRCPWEQRELRCRRKLRCFSCYKEKKEEGHVAVITERGRRA